MHSVQGSYFFAVTATVTGIIDHFTISLFGPTMAHIIQHPQLF